VSGRIRRFSVALILLACLGAPILEMCDHWDHTLQNGNDTESNVVIVALCVGVALITAIEVVVAVPSTRSDQWFVSFPVPFVFPERMLAPLTPDIRPPTILRV
jgi:hypothetical protein